MTVSIITSGAYVDAEIAAEFGLLPPSFLPVGNQRLYALQREELAPFSERVVLTLPESFSPPGYDREKLETLGIEVLPVPDGLSLGNSIVYALNMLALGENPVALLHGDTLISGLSGEPDSVSVHSTTHQYTWAVYEETENGPSIHEIETPNDPVDGEEVLSGFFAFSSAQKLIQALTRCGERFVEGLDNYSEHLPLKPAEGVGGWMDFGHLQTYHQARRRLTTERAFNFLEFGRHAVTKKSRDMKKMQAEAAWFRDLPKDIKVFAPLYLGQEEAGSGYCLSNEYLCTLSDLYVFGVLSRRTWRRIFESCQEFTSLCSEHVPSVLPDMDALYRQKTEERLTAFCRENNIDMCRSWTLNGRYLPSLSEILDNVCSEIAPFTRKTAGVMHGDLCFSNIFYDFRRQAIKVIDPRGSVDCRAPSIYGDLRYDVAKMMHSVVGRYDFIIADFYTLREEERHQIEFLIPESKRLSRIEEEFLSHDFGAGVAADSTEILAITILLFLSMLPLHADRPERQRAFLANALRLYLLLDSGGR